MIRIEVYNALNDERIWLSDKLDEEDIKVLLRDFNLHLEDLNVVLVGVE